MGSQSSNSFKEQYQIISHPMHAHPLYKHIPSQQLYQSISLFSPPSSQQAFIDKINHRKNQPSQYVQPIKQFIHQTDNTVCGTTSKLVLLVAHPSPTLEQHARYRRIKGRTFSLDQILVVVKSVCLGLKQVKNIGQQHGHVTMGNIIVNKRVMIVDPLYLQRDDQYNYKNDSKRIKGFPSPEKLVNHFDQLSNFQEYHADLFSVGVIALQMYFINKDMSVLYKNKNPVYCNNSLDNNLLFSYLNLLKQPILKEVISSLVSFDPKKRTHIYSIIPSLAINDKNLKILRQNPIAIKSQDYLMEPITPLDYSAKQSSQAYIRSEQISVKTGSSIPMLLNGSHLQAAYPQSNKSMQPHHSIMSGKSPNINHVSKSANKQPIHLPYHNSNHSHSNSTVNHASNDLRFTSSISSINSTIVNHSNLRHPIQYHHRPFYQPIKQQQRLQTVSYQPITTTNLSKDDHANTQIERNKVSALNDSQFDLKNSISQQKLAFRLQKQGLFDGESFVKHQQDTKRVESLDSRYYSIDQTLKRLEENMRKFTSTNHKLDSSVVLYDIPKPNNHIQQLAPHIQPTSIAPHIESAGITPKVQPIIQQTNNSINERHNNKIFDYSIIQEVSLQNSYAAQPGEQYIVQQYVTGARYEGYKKNGKRNGIGKFYYTEKSVYNGEWKDNKMNGFGVLTYASGNLAYEGYWKNDQFHGKGIIHNQNPDYLETGFDYKDMNRVGDFWRLYEGESSQGMKQGHGRLTLTNGETYQGEFLLDLVHGEGLYTCLGGIQIRGLWRQGIFLDLQHFLQQSSIS